MGGREQRVDGGIWGQGDLVDCDRRAAMIARILE